MASRLPPKIVSRLDWGALPPTSEKTFVDEVKYVKVSMTDTEGCETNDDCVRIVQELQRDHINNRAMTDIAFNFLLGGNGTFYEGRGWMTVPIKAKTVPDLNGVSNSVGYIGKKGTRPTKAMIDLVYDLIAYGSAMGYLTENAALYVCNR